jgi:hypothetical protein
VFECGVCDGPGAVYECGCSDFAEGACDCDGNIEDDCGTCGGTATSDDECGPSEILDGCELSSNEVFLTSTGDVLYNVPGDDIGGFQFNVDGATVLSASGGAAQTAGFVIQGGGSTVLAFSFTGSVVPAGCGTLTSLALDGDATGLSGLVFSDGGGLALNVTYYAGPVLGCVDETACNYNSSTTIDDGSCEYPLENYDCNGNCIVNTDCVGECGGSAIVDECGNCEGTCIMTDTTYFGLDVSDFIICSESENNIVEAGCDGVCGSPYMADACGNCSGDCSYIDPETEEPYEDGLMVCSENAGIIIKLIRNPIHYNPGIFTAYH